MHSQGTTTVRLVANAEQLQKEIDALNKKFSDLNVWKRQAVQTGRAGAADKPQKQRNPMTAALRVFAANPQTLTRDGEIVTGGVWALDLGNPNAEYTLDELERIARYLYTFARRERAAQEAREGWGRPE